MSHATVIYPHQLFAYTHPVFKKDRPIFLIEEPLFLTEFSTHRQKQLLHRTSMTAYAQELTAHGFTVTHLDVRTYPTTDAMLARVTQDGVTHLHICDVTDDWLTKRLKTFCTKNAHTVTWYKSDLFLVTDDHTERYLASKRHMAHFYKKMRLDYNILIEADGTPTGGKWSFDEDNRLALKRDIVLPPMAQPYTDPIVAEALLWQHDLPGEQYGDTTMWLPYTRAGAQAFLEDFLTKRFTYFGPYEDALTTTHPRLFHSTLSPLINIGLLSPRYVLDRALSYAHEHNTPIQSLEGFIRQILGWREFIRAAYETDGRTMRTTNFFNHSRSLPSSFWTGTTGVLPLDTSIKNALTYGYNHHIERLMVLGNFMLLTQTNPDDVYRWFMAMYVDAYDWVMVPNVYGMSQFADGGLFATKPYIAGGNYLRKMSDYPKGSWETLYTALYWNFIATHQEFFLKNHRLSMMPRLLQKMNPRTRQTHLDLAQEHLRGNT